MTAYNSTQETKRTAIPPKPLDTNELKGRVRIAHFRFVVPAGNAAIADTVNLTAIPAGARIIGGNAAWEAMSTGAGTAQIQIGTSATANAYLDTTSVDAAGSAAFANTVALAYGTEVADETVIVATVAGEAWAAGKVLTGHLLYVLD